LWVGFRLRHDGTANAKRQQIDKKYSKKHSVYPQQLALRLCHQKH
jgi:hypothetical protein